MKQRYTQANFYSTTMQSGITLTPATSGRTQVPLTSLPAIPDNKYYHVIYNPSDTSARFVMRVYNESWLCYVDNVDIWVTRTLVIKKEVAIFDVAEMFNELWRNTDDFWVVDMILGNSAKIRWGYCNFSGTPVVINDSSVTSLANGTRYAVLNFLSSTLTFSTTIDYTSQYLLGTIVVTSWVWVYTDNRSLDLYKNRSTLDKFSEVWWVLYWNWRVVNLT